MNNGLKRIWAITIDFIIIILVFSLLKNFIPLNTDLIKLELDINIYITNLYNLSSINMSNINETLELFIKLFKLSINNYLLEIVTYIIFLVIIPCFNNGASIGKKIMKLKIVNIDDKKVSFLQLLARTILNNGIYIIISVILLTNINIKTYLFGIILLTLVIVYLFSLIKSCIMIINKKDGRGIHDIITKTKVIDVRG